MELFIKYVLVVKNHCLKVNKVMLCRIVKYENSKKIGGRAVCSGQGSLGGGALRRGGIARGKIGAVHAWGCCN